MKFINTLPLFGLVLSGTLLANGAAAQLEEGKLEKKAMSAKFEKKAMSAKIEKISRKVKTQADRSTEVSVIIELNSPEHRTMLKAMKKETEESQREHVQKVRELVKDNAPRGQFATKNEEKAALDSSRKSQPFFLQNSLREINEARESEKQKTRSKMKDRLKSITRGQQQKFARVIENMGGKVEEFIHINNSVAVTIPVYALEELSAHPEVIRISENSPGAPELSNQALSLGVSAFWNASDGPIDGGVWDAGILDGGVEETHSALSSHTFLENYAPDHYHGTGIACMYGSTHATHKGLAYGMDKFLVDNAGGTATSMAGADWMVSDASDDPEVINYSWGNGSAASSTWGDMARFVDGVVNNHSVVWVKSAGNQGYGASTTMTQPGENYNGITVTNMYDNNTVTRTDDVIWSSSSRGPAADGRRKPDISAPGHNTYTCDLGNTWDNMGGTSSAAPKVGAGAILLQDAGHYLPISIKATLINTADSWDDNDTQTTADDGQVTGKEWNRTYGWGYLDLGHAAFHRDDYFIDYVSASGSSTDYDLYVGQGWIGDKATLVWERDVDYNDASAPTTYKSLSDLNMRLYNEDDQVLEDYDFSSKDNVHQVAVESSGMKVIKVYAWNSSVTERFALATEEGFSRATGPAFTQATSELINLFPSRTYRLSTTITNTGDLKAHGLSASVTLPAGVSLYSGTASRSLAALEAGDSVTVSWTVTASSFSLLNNVRYNVNSNSYGETFSNSSY